MAGARAFPGASLAAVLSLVLTLLNGGAAAVPAVSTRQQPSSVAVLSWNVHWQCGSNYIHGCQANATARFLQLAEERKANIVVAIELEATSSTPVDLPSHGFGSGWTAVNGSCPGAAGKTGDALSINLKDEDYTVIAHGGGCLGGAAGGNYKADARAFAVALAKPTMPVAGCAALCVIGLHSPHVAITEGNDTVASVCGDARHSCTIAAGDWNAPISRHDFCNYTVQDRWAQLVGPSAELASGAQLYGAPDKLTCCYPNTKYMGWDDHVVTNIAHGVVEEATALGYQMSTFSNDTEEHMPIYVALHLPAP